MEERCSEMLCLEVEEDSKSSTWTYRMHETGPQHCLVTYWASRVMASGPRGVISSPLLLFPGSALPLHDRISQNVKVFRILQRFCSEIENGDC